MVLHFRCDSHEPCGEIYTTPNVDGGALWLRPAIQSSIGQAAMSERLSIPFRLDRSTTRSQLLVKLVHFAFEIRDRLLNLLLSFKGDRAVVELVIFQPSQSFEDGFVSFRDLVLVNTGTVVARG